MGIKNPYKTFTYRHPDWAEGSEWAFRGAKTEADDTTISGLAQKTIMGDVDMREMHRAWKRGEDVTQILMDATTQETIMSTRVATLAHMSIGWTGAEMAVPADFPADPTDPDGPTHELAGQVPPCTAEWISLWDGDDLDEILLACNRAWSGRSPEELIQFPGATADAPRSTGRAKR